MKRLFTTLLSIPIYCSLIFSQCVEVPQNKILLVGDSWAAFQNGYGTINEGLKNLGHSDKRFVSSLEIAENGADTYDFVDGPKQIAIQEIVDANTDIEIVHLSIGGNDVLGDWNISFTPEQTDSLTQTVEVRLETIIDFLQATRSGMRVFWPGYTYPNFGEIIEEFDPFQNVHPFFSTWDGMGQPNFLTINTVLNNMSDSVLATTNADPLLDFIPAQGVIQHFYGQTTPLGVAPGGTYAQFDAPLPFGYPEYPSPQNGMGLYAGAIKDCFHLSADGYLTMFTYQAQKFYHKLLMDDLYLLSDGSNSDGSVSSTGDVSQEVKIGEEAGSELAAVLTFDTPQMADTTLSGASIFLRIQDITGTNPIVGNDFLVKMKNGTFGISVDVEAVDYMDAPDTEGEPCRHGGNAVVGNWIRLDLTAEMLAGMNNSNKTQFLISIPGFTGGTMTFNDASDPETAPVLNLNYGPSPNGIYNLVNRKELPVYPVPTTGPLTIDVDSYKLESVEVLNVLGKVVMTPASFDNTIDISGLPNGSYILRITTDEGVSAKRIIKR
jgi:hypothetical protein